MRGPAASPDGHTDSSSSTPDFFRLSGPSNPPDRRIHAFRHDLADIALADRVLAPHYARGLMRGCGAYAALVRVAPDDDADALSELLPGESFAVLEYAAGWAWGYCAADHVVGYVETIALADLNVATHIVCEKCAPVAADDRITSPVLASLPMGARLQGVEQGACLTTEYGCVPLSHLRRAEDHDDDPVVVAERLIGVPYRAGGRTWNGVDAPGLVQLAISLCGLPAPHLPEQLARLGQSVPDGAALRRGDLVVAGGKAGLMIDDLMLIHASESSGKVTAAPVASLAGPDLVRRRLPL